MLHNTIHSRLGRVLLSIGGTLLYAVGVNLFIVPLGLYTGGVLGVSQLIRTLVYRALDIGGGFDFSGLLYYVLNIPIFLLAYRTLGKVFLRGSLLCTTTSSLFLSAVPIPALPLVDDVLAGCLLGGALVGLGAGLVLTCGSSLGGLDMLGLYFSKKGAHFTLGRLSLIFNSVLFSLCGLLFDVRTLLYSVLYTVFFSLVLDRVHQQSVNVQVLLFTKEHAREISVYIMETLHRGVTRWDGQGAYTGEPVQILCTCMSKYEIGDLREALHQLDPHAFYTVQEGVRVSDNFIKRLSE